MVKKIIIALTIFLILVSSINLTYASKFGYDYLDSETVKIITSDITNFTELTDTPGSYTGDGGNCVAVNGGETGLEFVACAAGQGSSFNATYDSFAYNQTLAALTNYILELNTTGNIQNLINATDIYSTYNATYDSGVGGSTYNITYDTWAYNQTEAANETIFIVYDDRWSTTYNETYDAFNSSDNILGTIGGIYNVSYLTSVGDISTFNATYDSFAYNFTIATNLTIFTTYDERWSVVYNITYNTFAYNMTEATLTNYILDLNTTGNIQNLLNSTNIYSTYNATYDAASSGSTYNETYDSYNFTTQIAGVNDSNNILAQTGGIYNITYHTFAYNQTEASAGGTYNETYDSYNFTERIDGVNDSDNILALIGGIYNASYLTGVGDIPTYNVTYDGNLIWGYNQTTGTFNEYGQWWYNHTQAANLSIFTTYDSRWSTTYNATYDGLINGGTYNETYDSYNFTDQINGVNDTNNILALIGGIYNISYDGNLIWGYNQTEAVGDIYVRKDGDNMTGTLNVSAPIISSQNINGTARSFLINNHPGGIASFRSQNNIGSFVSLSVSGPEAPLQAVTGEFLNDSGGVFLGTEASGDMFMVNGANTSIIFGHSTEKSPLFDDIEFSLVLENTGNLLLRGGLFLEDNNKTITTEQINGGSAMIFTANQTLSAGETPFIWRARNSSGGSIVPLALQNGKNESGGYFRNSIIIGSDTGINIEENLTNCIYMANEYNFSIRVACDTSTTGSDMILQDAAIMQQLYLDDNNGRGKLRVEGEADIILRNTDTDFNVVGGPMHIRQERIVAVGQSPGENVSIFQETFESGTMGQFTNNFWTAGNFLLCPNSGGIGGDFCAENSGATAIETDIANFNANGFNITNMSIEVTADLDGLGSNDGLFQLILTNSSGTQAIVLELDTVDTVDTTYTNLTMDNSFNNDTSINVSILYDGSVGNNIYIDNIRFNGLATVDTTANITTLDSQIKMGSGSGDGIFYYGPEDFGESQMNLTADIINFIGNTSFTSVTEETLNVTDSIDVTNNITVGDTTITDKLTLGAEDRITSWSDLPVYNVTYDGFTMWGYNQTIPANQYTDLQITNINTSTNILELTGGIYNVTYDQFAYNQTEAAQMGTYNETYDSYNFTTQIEGVNDSANILSQTGGIYNITYDSYNFTDEINGVNTSDNILSVIGGIYNASYLTEVGDVPTYNVTYDGLIQWGYNHTQAANETIFTTYDEKWSVIYNITYDTFAYNMTEASLTNYINDVNTSTNILNVIGGIYNASYEGGDSNWNVTTTSLYPDDLDYNVGIGTDSPTHRLHVKNVSGDARVTIESDDSAASLRLDAGGTGSWDNIEFYKAGTLQGRFTLDSMNNFFIQNASTRIFEINGTNGNINITNELHVWEKIGIGTNLPTHTLNVLGSANITGDLIMDSTNFFSNGSSIGIGKVPEELFDVNRTLTLSDSVFNGENTFSNSSILRFDTQAQSISAVDNQWNVQGQVDAVGDYNLRFFNSLYSGGTGSILNLFTNAISARVGINTNNPTHELNVVGDANITGDTYIDNKGHIYSDGANLIIEAT